MSTRHDVNQRENKHPDEVDEVPVKSADLDVFVLQLIDSRSNYRQVNRARSDVEHVQSGNGEEGRAKER